MLFVPFDKMWLVPLFEFPGFLVFRGFNSMYIR